MNQFLARVSLEMSKAVVGIISKTKYINGEGGASLRNRYWRPLLKTGIVFPSAVFKGVNGDFPISFGVWDLGEKVDRIKAEFIVLNEELESIGLKTVEEPATKLLPEFVKKGKVDADCLPMDTQGMLVSSGRRTSLSKMVKGAIGFLCFHSSDVQHNKETLMLSTACYRGNGFSVTPEMLDKSMMMWAVRQLVKPTWLNDKDLYTVPDASRITPEFQSGCWAFCLWHASNKTTSLRGVEWDGRRWDVRNPFAPYDPATIAATSPAARALLRRARMTEVGSRVAAMAFTPAAQAVMDAGMDIVRLFWASYDRVDLAAHGIADWDAGFCQMARALAASGATRDEYAKLDAVLKERLRALRAGLLPCVYEFGFLPREMVVEEAGE